MQRVRRSSAVVSLPTPPGGGTPGYFASPSALGGIPATVPGYEWFNSVQEEICAIIAAAGVTLDIANTGQLLTALRSAGVFQTPAQFDASTKAATMAALARMGLQSSGFTIVSTNTTLTAAVVGGTVQVSGSAGPITLTLPAASAVAPAIGRIEIINSSPYVVTVVKQGSDSLGHVSGVAAGSGIALQAGDCLTVECQAASLWIAVNGSADLAASASFASSIGSSGYQKLPSGLIVQWGVTSVAVAANTSTANNWSFPLAFPNACLQVFAIPGNYVTSTRTAETFITTSCNGFAQHTAAVTLTTRWLAIGY